MIQLTDKSKIDKYLRRCAQFNYYHLGDLDEFFWPHTRWYALERDGNITALVLLYTAPEVPVLLAILNDNQPEMEALLTELIPELPEKVYAHLSPGLDSLFSSSYHLDHHGEHYKMVLTDPNRLAAFDTGGVVPLGPTNLPELEALYQAAYPGNWFDPRMLETGQYVGIRSAQGELVCVAGVHVYSPEYRVAALGNITTHPDYRGQGLATIATAGLCTRVLERVDVIGLNVLSGNQAAIHAYRKVGFEVVATYHEWMLERDPANS